MADALFSINGDSSNQGFDATAAQVLTLRLKTLPVSGVDTVRFQVWDASAFDPVLDPLRNPPRKAKDSPNLTLVGATSGPSVSPVSVDGTVQVTMPGSDGHAWILRCVVNGGESTLPDGRVVFDPRLVHERMIVIRDASGGRPIVATETTQYEDDGWAPEAGRQGPAGAAGADGAPGAAGRDGADGRDGVDGVDGRNGVDGATGATGATGAAGSGNNGSIYNHLILTSGSSFEGQSVTSGHSVQVGFSEAGHPGISRIRIAAAAAANTYHGWTAGPGSGNRSIFISDIKRVGYRFRVSLITGLSFAIGIGTGSASSGTLAGAFVGVMGTEYAAFSWDPAVNANLQCVTRTSIGGTTTTTTTAITLTSGTWYDFEIERDVGGNLLFYVDGVLVATHSTNTPVDQLFLKAQFRATSTNASTRDVDCDLYNLQI